ncbi:MAG: alcohol dehydrogenase catalytic domain-containing protein, partial [Chloroflexota bacterium]
MKAAVINYYGSTDALEIAEVQTPQVDPNQVLVKVRAAAVNPKDTFIRKGRFKRLSGNQFPQFTGFDFAGEVADVGTNVKEIELGQSVFGLLDGFKGGACAEYVVADRSQVGRLPELASFEEAASLPLVSLTA